MSSPLSLLEVLADIPDPRHRRGIRHPLPAILGLAVVAMLTGCKSYQAIAQFGRDKGFALAHVLGFRRGKTPTKATYSLLFRRLDVVAFEAAMARWIATRLSEEEMAVLALDGKTLRGSRDGVVPGRLRRRGRRRADAGAGRCQDQRTQSGLAVVGDCARPRPHPHGRRPLLPTRPVPEDPRRGRRLCLHGQGQSTVAGDRHPSGLELARPAAAAGRSFFPPTGSRLRRGRAAQPRRRTKGTADRRGGRCGERRS
jgi:hypothetical protein